MTCKENCIHYPVCKDTVADENWTDEAPKELREMYSPKNCETFLSNVDVAPVVHGEWIEYSGDPNIITCSECDWGTSPEEKGFKFCPNCGAIMDGGNK